MYNENKINKWGILITLGLTPLFFLSTRYGTIRNDVKKENYIDYANQSQFNCVGTIIIESRAMGSCVLIDKDWIITAAHNFETEEELTQMLFVVGDDTVKGKEVYIHPKYEKKDVDLALIKLERSLATNPALIYNGNSELDAEASFVGYGVFGTASHPSLDEHNQLKIAGTNMIDQIGGKIAGVMKFEKHLLLSDFDEPNDTVTNRIGEDKPLPLEYQMNGGDSGGGVFIKENGKWYLVGIISGNWIKMKYDAKLGYGVLDSDYFDAHGTYGSVDMAVRLSVFKKWIQNIKKE